MPSSRHAVYSGRTGIPITSQSTPGPYRAVGPGPDHQRGHGRLQQPENSAPYQHLINRIEAVSTDKRYEFMFAPDGAGQHGSGAVTYPAYPRRRQADHNHRLSGVPSEIVDVVVSVLCRLIFEFVLWSDRAKALPILLVCEEAHRWPRPRRSGRVRADQALDLRGSRRRAQIRPQPLSCDPAPGGAVRQQPVPVQHDLRAPPEQRQRPRVRTQRGAGQLPLAD